MKRVLVAGAAGYLGGFTVQELKSRGYFVRALARVGDRRAAVTHNSNANSKTSGLFCR